MRRLAFLIVCTGLFGGLLYAMAHLTEEPVESLRSELSPSAPSERIGTDTTASAPGFALQLDRSLGQTPVAAAPTLSASPSPLDRFRRPSFARQAALLAASLLLGWFASHWLRAGPRTPVVAPENPVAPELEPADDLQRQAHADRAALEQVQAQLDDAQRLLEARSNEDLDDTTDINQEELSALQHVIDSRELEVTESRERVTLLEQTIEELRRDLSSAEHEIEHLGAVQREQLEQFEQERRESQQVHSEEFEEYDGVVNSLRTKNDEWQQQLSSQSEALHHVEQQLSDAQAAFEDASRELTDVMTERESHLATIDSLEKIQSSQQAHVSDLLGQLEQEAAAAAERADELDVLKQRHLSLEQDYAELESRQEQRLDELKHAQNRAADADTLDDEVNTLNAELERVTTARDEYIAELSEMHSLFSQAQLRAAQADDLEAAAAQRVADLESVTTARDEAQEKVTALSAQCADDQARLEQLDRETTDAKERLDVQERDLEATRTELDRTKERLTVAETERDELHALKESLHDQLEDLETREHELRVQYDQTAREHASLSAENTELSDSITLLREDLADVVRKTGERNTEIEQLHRELDKQNQALSDEHERAQELMAQIEQGHIARESLEEQLEIAREFEQKLQTWDGSLQTYRDDIAAKNRLIDELRDTSDAANAERDQWQIHTEALEDKLKLYVDLQQELDQTLEEYNGVGETLARQQTELDELLALGQQSDEQLKAHSDSLQALEQERETWLQTVEKTTRTAEELEAELLDQHDVLLTLDEIVSETLAAQGVTSEHALLTSDSDNPASATNTLIVRKGKALSTIATDSADRASSFEQHKLELAQKVADLEQQLSELTQATESKLAASHEEQEALTAQLEEAVQDQQQLSEKHDDIKTAGEELRIELEERSRALAELETQHAALTQESEQTQLALSAELEQTRNSLQQETEGLAALAETARAQTLRVEDLEQQLDTLNREHTEQRAELNEELAQNQAEQDVLVERAQTLEQQLAELERDQQTSSDAMTQERDQLKTKLEALVDEHARLEDHAQTLALQVDQQSREHQETIDQLQLQRSEELEAQRGELQSRIDTIMDEHEKLQDELEQMRQLQNELSSDVDSKNQEIDELRRQLSESQKQFEQQTADISAQIDQQRQTLDHAATRVSEAEEVWAKTDTALQAANTERQQSEYEVQELRELLRTVERVGASDREALKDLQKELGRKREALDVAEQAFHAQRREVEEISTAREAAVRQMEEQQARYAQLEDRLKTALAEQRGVNARLRAQLERSTTNTAAATVPVLTQKVVEGATQPDIPVLGQPVVGGHTSDKPELPVLEKPVERGKS